MPHPIVLHCDLKVDPAREQDLLDRFHNQFRPVAARFRGFIDLKLLKLRIQMGEEALPAAVNYRFQLTYESEELRQAWVASPEHAELWPPIAACLAEETFHVSVWDDA